MTFSVIWHPKAAKQVELLPKQIRERVLRKIDEVAQEPFRFLEHFEGDCYKLRIGEYRALLDVEFNKKVLKIQVSDKRERVY